jgi:hypothetical protein
MKKIFVLTMVLFLMISGTAFAQGHRGQPGTAATSQSGAAAQVSQTFEGSNVPVQMNSYPNVTGPMVQQNNAPSGKDKHWNRIIKPWALKTCWTEKDKNRLENNFSLSYASVSDKGTLQFIPLEDLKGAIKSFTIIPPAPKAEVDQLYTLIAAGSIFASDSETSYMQQWVKVLKANMTTIGATFVMIIDEGSKEGAEAFGWHLGLSVGANALNTGGNQGIGATVGMGVSDTQTKAEEYPHLTILFLTEKAPIVKK